MKLIHWTWLPVYGTLTILLVVLFTTGISWSQENEDEDLVSSYMQEYTGADADKVGSSNCLMCHSAYSPPEDPLTHPGLFENNPDGPFFEKGCELCHGPGGSHMGDVAGIINPSLMNGYEITGLCSRCHATLGSYNRDGWDLSRHSETGFTCFTCHSGHSENASFLTVEDKEELCNRCHGAVASGSDYTEHHPVEAANLNCFTCHNQHSGEFQAMLKKAPEELCTTCHGDKHDLQASADAGLGLGVTNCLDCHFEGAGGLWGSDRCFTCHFDLFPEPQFTHAAIIDSDPENENYGHGCEACHGAGGTHLQDPRGILQPTTLDPEGVTDLCSMCHDDLRTYNQRNWGLSEHYSADLSCLNCHGGHSVEESFLLNESGLELCYTCHADKRALFNMRSHHPVEEGRMACTACHNTHSGQYESQLNAERDELCYGCHADKQGPFIYDHDVSLSSGGDGCFTCHFVHGSNTDNLTRYPQRLCQECHTDRDPSTHFPGSCWTAGCHTEIHGSNQHPLFFN